MAKHFLTVFVLLILLQPIYSEAKFCRSWSAPKNEGTLERKQVPEASGLAASIRYPGRYYWINDSGNKAILFHSTVTGANLKGIRLKETKFRDTEALSVAACGEDSCVIVGDVGNNRGKQRNPVIYVYKEQDLNGASAKPWRKVEFTYPDGPHDVEAMAVLPDGQMIFITKELALMSTAEPTVFALSKTEWLQGSGRPEAKRIGTLPMRQWLPDQRVLGTAITDAAVNTERGVLGILTYSALIEIPLTWPQDRDFALVPIETLKQQESLTYDIKGESVIWSSEFIPPSAPIYSMTCERPDF